MVQTDLGLPPASRYKEKPIDDPVSMNCFFHFDCLRGPLSASLFSLWCIRDSLNVQDSLSTSISFFRLSWDACFSHIGVARAIVYFLCAGSTPPTAIDETDDGRWVRPSTRHDHHFLSLALGPCNRDGGCLTRSVCAMEATRVSYSSAAEPAPWLRLAEVLGPRRIGRNEPLAGRSQPQRYTSPCFSFVTSTVHPGLIPADLLRA